MDSFLIPNGVSIPRIISPGKTLEKFRLTPGKYVLHVSRLVPEKRHEDLLQAFQVARLAGWKVAIVGASDHPDEYVRRVLAQIQQTPGAIAVGFQSGDALGELYSNAGMFVLPSSHEGLPIALLEALSYGLPSIASAIPANLEVGLPSNCYFPVGNLDVLSACMHALAEVGRGNRDTAECRKRVIEKYDWREKGSRTVDVYHRVSASASCTRPQDSSTS